MDLCFLLYCFISTVSGEVPEEPVVSEKSGLLYEKRLIERHISVCYSIFFNFFMQSRFLFGHGRKCRARKNLNVFHGFST